jgi:hypothetical protein
MNLPFGTSSFIFIKNTAQSGKNCGEKIVLGQYRFFAKVSIFKIALIFTSKSCDRTEAAVKTSRDLQKKGKWFGLEQITEEQPNHKIMTYAYCSARYLLYECTTYCNPQVCLH